MFGIENAIALPPFSLRSEEKSRFLLGILSSLTRYHHEKCLPYQRILNRLFPQWAETNRLGDLPFLPVPLFKKIELSSIASDRILKKLVSSGTSGNGLSQIILDGENSTNQSKALSKIVGEFLGPKRLPMIILDSEATPDDRNQFSARIAAIKGFSIFSKESLLALDDKMELRFEQIKNFCHRFQSETIFLFGFTFVVWKYFYSWLTQHNLTLPMDKAILIHGGGWKKMENEAVDSHRFKEGLCSVSGIHRVHNYYGLIEQAGSIFVECEAGFFHCSNLSDILIRDSSFSIVKNGQPGIVQLVSILPTSYPGHSILTEDLGVIYGEDECTCGRLGKYFRVIGRAPKAEIRGCSDAMAA